MRRIIEDRAGIPNAVAFSPDGESLFTAYKDRVLAWNIQTNEVLTSFCGHDGEVTDLVVTDDQQYVVAAVRSSSLFAWQLHEENRPERLDGHEGEVSALARGTGNGVLSAGTDGRILSWNLRRSQAECIGRLPEPIQSLARFTHINQLLIASGPLLTGPSNLVIWDLSRHEPVMNIPYELGSIDAVTVAGDDRCILAAANHTLLRWTLPDGTGPEEIGRHNWRISRIVSNRDGTLAVTSDTGGKLGVWDLVTNSCHPLNGHRTNITGISLNNKGTLASASFDGTVRLWEFPPPIQATPSFGHDLFVNDVRSFIKQGKPWAVTASEDNSIALWDLTDSIEMARLTLHAKGVKIVVPLLRQGRCVSAGWDGLIVVWDLASEKPIHHWQSPDSHLVALEVDLTESFAVTAPFNGSIRVWDLHGTEIAAFEAAEGAVSCLAISDDGAYVIAGGREWSVFSLHENELRCLHTITNLFDADEPPSSSEAPITGRFIHHITINAVSIVSGTSKCLLATASGELLLYDFVDNRVISTWKDGPCGIADISISPTGRWVATVGSLPLAVSDDALRIWDMKTGRVVARFIGDCPMTCCTAFDNPNRIIVGDAWGRLHLFSLEGDY